MTEDLVPSEGVLLGRAFIPGCTHPRLVTVRDRKIFDITTADAPTSRDICELGNPAAYIESIKGRHIGPLSDILYESWNGARDGSRPYLLSPVDLQAVKASGVTFVVSLLERVIEEQAAGDPSKAADLRNEITALVGADLSQIEPGSDAAMEVKKALIEKGVWSQYLEVGIGPDAEIFTKCQPMASVGFGADVGLHPVSKWNNPEPEVALIVSSKGEIVGATLGNDVNLRDVEGRSALLLGKAKDNNASAALGPFIRLFDSGFGLDDVKALELTMTVTGEDGFVLDGASSMSEISRPPEKLVAATVGSHHQYPDGFVLYLGTMFAPIKDRDAKGSGFTHKLGDVVAISTPALGTLKNRVQLSTQCAPWTYGASHLMRDLAKAGLL